MLIAPSILSANFLDLGSEVRSICDGGCDYVHIDIMDGHFVPNLTIGPLVVKEVAKISSKPLDIHLMVENVSFFVDMFAPIKPEFMSVHIEEVKHLNRLISHIRNSGIRPGVVLNPHTSEEALKYIIEDVDMVLLMSVNPGFGGQKFIPNIYKKIQNLKDMIFAKNPNCLIEVDGGVNDKNIDLLKQSGADIVVAGNYIFSSDDYQKAILSLR
ncbi:ribulose-phosphate 3-epimerase [Helicobacter cappadocius]|uniref:Ribulose-phosphate 3-epimerase n=1 Tax=Helicobacter cappadocius TaxID=3063998 RepID=A0AA90PIT2_9HELI|nr:MULTISPECIES: ribulose-phosphate 3-epimerase [unclassified Helicobacter]MDO7252498.1 ribulose-phosphate 3-epimerase [Helicobacter sp. faydin-H75]MDP2538365.1 ribulose-phosphate 3-epimerase [Helicobacter sp. faydin-H76]